MAAPAGRTTTGSNLGSSFTRESPVALSVSRLLSHGCVLHNLKIATACFFLGQMGSKASFRQWVGQGIAGRLQNINFQCWDHLAECREWLPAEPAHRIVEMEGTSGVIWSNPLKFRNLLPNVTLMLH